MHTHVDIPKNDMELSLKIEIQIRFANTEDQWLVNAIKVCHIFANVYFYL